MIRLSYRTDKNGKELWRNARHVIRSSSRWSLSNREGKSVTSASTWLTHVRKDRVGSVWSCPRVNITITTDKLRARVCDERRLQNAWNVPWISFRRTPWLSTPLNISSPIIPFELTILFFFFPLVTGFSIFFFFFCISRVRCAFFLRSSFFSALPPPPPVQHSFALLSNNLLRVAGEIFFPRRHAQNTHPLKFNYESVTRTSRSAPRENRSVFMFLKKKKKNACALQPISMIHRSIDPGQVGVVRANNFERWHGSDTVSHSYCAGHDQTANR